MGLDVVLFEVTQCQTADIEPKVEAEQEQSHLLVNKGLLASQLIYERGIVLHLFLSALMPLSIVSFFSITFFIFLISL
jgi:hypothetical protein